MLVVVRGCRVGTFRNDCLMGSSNFARAKKILEIDSGNTSISMNAFNPENYNLKIIKMASFKLYVF